MTGVVKRSQKRLCLFTSGVDNRLLTNTVAPAVSPVGPQNNGHDGDNAQDAGQGRGYTHAFTSAGG